MLLSETKGLTSAITAGNTEKVKDILDKGADINARIDGFTPVEWALSAGQAEVLRLLLDRGAEINTKGHGENTL